MHAKFSMCGYWPARNSVVRQGARPYWVSHIHPLVERAFQGHLKRVEVGVAVVSFLVELAANSGNGRVPVNGFMRLTRVAENSLCPSLPW